MNIYTIILAAGKGQRMNSATPKQFLTLYKKPLWYYSVNVFLETFPSVKIIIPTLKDSIPTIQKNIKKYFPLQHKNIKVIEGGEMRFHSVKNALALIPSNKKSIIFIHDAARCLIQTNLLKSLYSATQKYQSAIPIVGVTDSICQLEDKTYKYLDRSKVFSIQTPQVFSSDILLPAFHTEYKDSFTDDASVVEYAGHKIHFIEGDISNIKITYPIDIQTAKWHLKNRKF